MFYLPLCNSSLLRRPEIFICAPYVMISKLSLIIWRERNAVSLCKSSASFIHTSHIMRWLKDVLVFSKPYMSCMEHVSHPFTWLWISVTLWQSVALLSVKGKMPLLTHCQCCFLKAPRSQCLILHQRVAVKDEKMPPSLDLWDSLPDQVGNHRNDVLRWTTLSVFVCSICSICVRKTVKCPGQS